mgnify:CR=1 FL=1
MPEQMQKPEIIITQEALSDTVEILITCFEKSGDLEALFSDCKIEIMAHCHFLREMVADGVRVRQTTS